MEEKAKKKDNLNFIEDWVKKDVEEGKNDNRVQTRFPPEPNGYLHIGHAKAICINFGIAEQFKGICNLRFDDTNPVKEDVEYVDSIKEDIQWLGFKWNKILYASDYFQQLWDFAEKLILENKAYVDEQSAEEIANQKGTLTQPGIESPYRNRPAEESLTLFRRMNTGEFKEGAMTLRAKIDMAAVNMHFRDPIMYRILKHPHHRTGTTWNAYPMYDFAHGQSDYFEGVTHSICTLEFVPHRPLYDYYVNLLKDSDYKPQQIEFNRLNLTYCLMSKRKLLQLVNEKIVSGWDDPRMPTICGFRRKGYTPESIRNFIQKIGYTKYEASIDLALLEHEIREDLNKKATRVAAVLDPVKLIITNYPEDKVEMMEAINNPEDPEGNKHDIAFTRELFIERSDFMEDAPRKFFRMKPDKEVRLKNGYIVMCTGCKKNETGEIEEIYATYDPESRSGMEGSNRKVKGTLHWVSASHCSTAEVRLYDRLFTAENTNEAEDFHTILNPDSLKILTNCKVENFLDKAKPLDQFQFMRTGYFNLDPDSKKEGRLIFNRTISLKDSWAKMNKNNK